MSTPQDFRQIYCTHHAITEAEYFEHVLRKALPPHARAYRALTQITFYNKAHFRADLDFIDDIGRLRRYREFDQSVDEFISHPWNQRGLLRWWLGIRISTTRVRHIVREELKSHQRKTEAESAGKTAALPAETLQREAAPKNHPDSLLTEAQKVEIKSRLEQIDQGPAPVPLKLSSRRVAGVEQAAPGTTQLLERPRAEPSSCKTSEIDPVTQIEVLQVINERLKAELTRVTAQRDVLKQAAAILAAP